MLDFFNYFEKLDAIVIDAKSHIKKSYRYRKSISFKIRCIEEENEMIQKNKIHQDNEISVLTIIMHFVTNCEPFSSKTQNFSAFT